ncbi:MAG: hypothetical protein DMG13_31335, partial [Acidobacteria bacterium]
MLFFMELSTRRVEIGGIASRANGLWMAWIARNLTDGVDGFFKGKRYLIHDRDPLYTREFLSMLADVGIESVKLPPRSPNLNAYAERFVRTVKEKCVGQMIFFGEESLRNGIREFFAHYYGEGNHQRLENRLIAPIERLAAKNRNYPTTTTVFMQQFPPAGIRDADHPGWKPLRLGNPSECNA